MNWRHFSLIGTIVLIAAQFMLYSKPASAASEYDFLVTSQMRTDLTLYNDDWTQLVDMTGTYGQAMAQACPTEWGDFSAALSAGDLYWHIYEDGAADIVLRWTASPQPLTFQTDGSGQHLKLPSATWGMIAIGGRANFPSVGYCTSSINTSSINGNLISTTSPNQKLFLSTHPVTYPDGYEGENIPSGADAGTPEQKVPEYTYSISETGMLHLTYLKNIQPFLTGTSYVVINAMGDDWNGLQEEVYNNAFQPAGWLDDDITTLPDGYYKIRISHDQSLSKPPWVEPLPSIENVWIDIQVVAGKAISGSTVGCGQQTCNEQKATDSPVYRMFNALNIPVYGLQAAVLAPLDFLTELPNHTNNCSPLGLPLPFVNYTITMPCMTPIYEQYFGAIFTIYQTILIGLFAYYVAIKSFGNIKQIANPNDDSIETVKL